MEEEQGGGEGGETFFALAPPSSLFFAGNGIEGGRGKGGKDRNWLSRDEGGRLCWGGWWAYIEKGVGRPHHDKAYFLTRERETCSSLFPIFSLFSPYSFQANFATYSFFSPFQVTKDGKRVQRRRHPLRG